MSEEVTTLLVNMQRELTGGIAGVSAQVIDVKNDVADCKTGIHEVRAKQTEHDGRLHKLEQQTSGVGLTAAQKTALKTAAWSAVTAGFGWVATRIAALFSAFVCFVKTGGIRS